MKTSITTSLLRALLLLCSRHRASQRSSRLPPPLQPPVRRLLSQVPIPDPSTTEGFRLTALMSNSFQLQASDLAAAKAKDPATRSYAKLRGKG